MTSYTQTSNTDLTGFIIFGVFLMLTIFEFLRVPVNYIQRLWRMNVERQPPRQTANIPRIYVPNQRYVDHPYSPDFGSQWIRNSDHQWSSDILTNVNGLPQTVIQPLQPTYNEISPCIVTRRSHIVPTSVNRLPQKAIQPLQPAGNVQWWCIAPQTNTTVLPSASRPSLNNIMVAKQKIAEEYGYYRQISSIEPQQVHDWIDKFCHSYFKPNPTQLFFFADQSVLCSNIIKGVYRDVLHYIDVHVMLIKADYMDTIRDAITSFKANPALKVHMSGRFYHNTKLVGFAHSNIRIGILVSFDKSILNSTSFFHGALLFFSKDNFKSWFFGTVVSSYDCQSTGSIIVNFDDDLVTEMVFDETYVMFESGVFFLQYYPILKYLMYMGVCEILPMQNWILNSQDSENLPLYMQRYFNNNYYVYLPQNSSMTSEEFDEYQLEAFKTALSRNLVTIQGPPGTGKTYIGLKIVSELLRYIRSSEKPILVLACSNHALDQFLCGVLKQTTKNLIRIGGQSKVEDLNKIYNLKNKKSRNKHGKSLHVLLQMIEKAEDAFSTVTKFLTEPLNSINAIEKEKFIKNLKQLRFLLISRKFPVSDDFLKQTHDFNIGLKNLLALKSSLFFLIKLLHGEHAILSEKFNQVRAAADLLVLKNADVVGITTTAAAMFKPLLTALAPKIVIIEEAAQVLESHVVANLNFDCEHVIMIGDHQQLRPAVNSHRLRQDYNFDVSLFERLERGVNFRQLVTQHRMRPEISRLLTPSIYENLKNHSSVKDYPDVKGVAENVFFFDHNFPESKNEESLSYNNEAEARFAINLALYFIKQGYKPNEITILSAYMAQLIYLQELRKTIESLDDLEIHSIDSYQGLENKIVLVCLVRNNHRNKIGFLATSNRVCVALSRAKEGLFIFGNATNLTNTSKLWTSIIDKLNEKFCVGKEFPLKCETHDKTKLIKTNAEFNKMILNGSCHNKERKKQKKVSQSVCADGHVYNTPCFKEDKCEKKVLRTCGCERKFTVPCHFDLYSESFIKHCELFHKEGVDVKIGVDFSIQKFI